MNSWTSSTRILGHSIIIYEQNTYTYMETTLILITPGTGYLEERCRRYIRETTLILITLGTGYLEERCRCYIRVHQPRKLPSNEFRLIILQILTKLQETTLILSTLGTRSLSNAAAI
ncbi:hypothetical protein TSAR_006851 [Trichomalopsis sarcophagae]|uniref:Uncharacterized protein n=1 Tax=Trichomalopsis sarcophagae TaxID=543379 RepID=A0A232F948_9HYME|nr:hypothetical protein TSAR_006851 [Trichomalopsis sarcophagae]